MSWDGNNIDQAAGLSSSNSAPKLYRNEHKGHRNFVPEELYSTDSEDIAMSGAGFKVPTSSKSAWHGTEICQSPDPPPRTGFENTLQSQVDWMWVHKYIDSLDPRDSHTSLRSKPASISRSPVPSYNSVNREQIQHRGTSDLSTAGAFALLTSKLVAVGSDKLLPSTRLNDGFMQEEEFQPHGVDPIDDIVKMYLAESNSANPINPDPFGHLQPELLKEASIRTSAMSYFNASARDNNPGSDGRNGNANSKSNLGLHIIQDFDQGTNSQSSLHLASSTSVSTTSKGGEKRSDKNHGLVRVVDEIQNDVIGGIGLGLIFKFATQDPENSQSNMNKMAHQNGEDIRKIFVDYVFPHSSAESAMCIGDRILSVDRKDVKEMSEAEFRQAISGPIGSAVNLRFMRENCVEFTEHSVTLLRQRPLASFDLKPLPTGAAIRDPGLMGKADETAMLIAKEVDMKDAFSSEPLRSFSSEPLRSYQMNSTSNQERFGQSQHNVDKDDKVPSSQINEAFNCVPKKEDGYSRPQISSTIQTSVQPSANGVHSQHVLGRWVSLFQKAKTHFPSQPYDMLSTNSSDQAGLSKEPEYSKSAEKTIHASLGPFFPTLKAQEPDASEFRGKDQNPEAILATQEFLGPVQTASPEAKENLKESTETRAQDSGNFNERFPYEASSRSLHHQASTDIDSLHNDAKLPSHELFHSTFESKFERSGRESPPRREEEEGYFTSLQAAVDAIAREYSANVSSNFFPDTEAPSQAHYAARPLDSVLASKSTKFPDIASSRYDETQPIVRILEPSSQSVISSSSTSSIVHQDISQSEIARSDSMTKQAIAANLKKDDSEFATPKNVLSPYSDLSSERNDALALSREMADYHIAKNTHIPHSDSSVRALSLLPEKTQQHSKITDEQDQCHQLRDAKAVRSPLFPKDWQETGQKSTSPKLSQLSFGLSTTGGVDVSSMFIKRNPTNIERVICRESQSSPESSCSLVEIEEDRYEEHVDIDDVLMQEWTIKSEHDAETLEEMYAGDCTEIPDDSLTTTAKQLMLDEWFAKLATMPRSSHAKLDATNNPMTMPITLPQSILSETVRLSVFSKEKTMKGYQCSFAAPSATPTPRNVDTGRTAAANTPRGPIIDARVMPNSYVTPNQMVGIRMMSPSDSRSKPRAPRLGPNSGSRLVTQYSVPQGARGAPQWWS